MPQPAVCLQTGTTRGSAAPDSGHMDTQTRTDARVHTQAPASSWVLASPWTNLGHGCRPLPPVPGHCRLTLGRSRERAGRAAAAGLHGGGAAGTALSTTRVLCAAPSSTQTMRWAQVSGPGQTPAPGPKGDCLLCFGTACLPLGLRDHGAPLCQLRDVRGCHMPGPSVSGVLELS